jgi:hypothetical protein
MQLLRQPAGVQLLSARDVLVTEWIPHPTAVFNLRGVSNTEELVPKRHPYTMNTCCCNHFRTCAILCEAPEADS